MKKTAWLVAAVLLAAVFSSPVFSKQTMKLEIRAFPENPPAEVEINSVAMLSTPCPLESFRPGVYTVRVSRKGTILERRVLLKADTHVILVADFLKREILVKNRESLDYNPLQEETDITISPTSKKKSSPNRKTAPQPTQPADSDVKPGPNKKGPDVKEGNTEIKKAPESPPAIEETGEEPVKEEPRPLVSTADGHFGPPVPEKYRRSEKGPEKEVAKNEAGSGPEKEPQPPAQGPKTPEEKNGPAKVPPDKKEGPSKKYPHPCPPKEEVDCSKWDATTMRGAVYNYYCLLIGNDFNEAYNYWVTDRTQGWFYGAAQKFCSIRDFDIRGFEAGRETETTGRAKYVVDLKEQDGTVIETWKMETSLVKKDTLWMINSTRGKMVEE